MYDLTNPANLEFTESPADGYVTVFVYGKDRELNNSELTAIDTFVTNKSVPGLEVSIQNYNFAPLTIQLAITYNSTSDASAVGEIIKQSLVNAFDYMNFPTYKKDITSNYISAIAYRDGVGAGVINVSSCTMQHAGIVGYLAQGSTTFTATGDSISGAATYTGRTQSATDGSGTGAVFTITKTGSGTLYAGVTTVTITSGGSGYAVGDTITIPGASLGGATSANNLTLTITGTVGDSKYYSETSNTNTSTLSFIEKGYLPLITAADITITATPLVI